MSTQTTHRQRRELLDRLEKKYVKKVQLRAFHQEDERLKRSLFSVRGLNTKDLRLKFM